MAIVRRSKPHEGQSVERALNFGRLLSPLSFGLCTLSSYGAWIIVFRPSLWEIFLATVADILSNVVALQFDKKLFHRAEPQSRLYFPKLDWNAIGSLDEAGKISLFESLTRYPAKRALQVMWLSFVKTIPVCLVAVFVWQHETSNLVQFLKVVATTAVTFSYFYAACVIENHIVASDAIAEFHWRFDWTNVFSKAKINSHGSLRFKDGVSMFSIWLFVLAGEWLIVYTYNPNSTTAFPLAIEVGFVGLMGMCLSSRIWYLDRKFFVDGLDQLFFRFEKFDPTKRETLPLHTSPVLAQFEMTFNELNSRLGAYERELSSWIVAKTEESRYTALGEIAGLVVHDLSSPLHVINFCTRQLKENPELVKNQRYIEQLTTNGERSLELITSIRSYLKGSKSAVGTASVKEAITSVRKLCDTRFFTPSFEKIRFDVDPALAGIIVNISRPNLIHVLFNLVSNCIQNLLDNKIESAVIEVTLVDANGTIHITDNGTGLSSADFEKLTAFAYLPQDGETSQTGLGMKLVRRLVEQQGGSLKVLDVHGRQGTVFELKLSVHQPALEPTKGASHGS